MKKVIFICIDDTDTENSMGTGRLARDMAKEIEEKGLGEVHGITRHQLLLHEDVPYTSNNGNACLEVWNFKNEIYEIANEFMKTHFVLGSDPGLCICPKEKVSQEMIQFGKAAQHKVLLKEEAYQIANQNDIFLKELGGTGQGIIGALAGIGLRATGNDGRFIELPGIRDILEKTPVREIIKNTAIEAVIDLQGRKLPNEAVIDPAGWLRPYLKNGVATLIVGGPVARNLKDSSGGFYVPVRLG